MRKDCLFVILTLFHCCFAFFYKEGDDVLIKYDIDYRIRCFKDAVILRSFVKVSVGQCVKECAVRNSTCIAVMYDRRSTLCELVKKDGLEKVPNGGCVYIPLSKVKAEKLPSDDLNCDTGSEQCSRKECDMPPSDNFTIKGNLNGIGNTIEVHCDSGLYARFHCRSNGTWNGTIECPEYTNIAIDKPTNMTSIETYFPYPASNGVDGNLTSFFHTDRNNAHHWWWVDLQDNYTITLINITNRMNDSNCECSLKAKNLSVQLGPDLSSLTIVKNISLLANQSSIEPPNNSYARYVKIAKNATDSFHLVEVQVYGQNGTNIALNKRTNMSSIYGHPRYETVTNSKSDSAYPSKNGVDGKNDTLFFSDAVGTGAWWRVDLGKQHLIKSITLIQCHNCAGNDRCASGSTCGALQNMYVKLGTNLESMKPAPSLTDDHTSSLPSNTYARYVEIGRLIAHSACFCLAEVKVIGIKVPDTWMVQLPP